MARRGQDNSRFLRSDLIIDRELNPELFSALSKIKDGRRRADFIRNCAEKYLIMPKTPQWIPANGVTYHHSSEKPQTTALELSDNAAESNKTGNLGLAPSVHRTPPGSVLSESPVLDDRGSSQATPVRQATSPSLSIGRAESHKRPGAAALARALPGGTPGLR